jgi:hypothetical protein
MEISAVRHHSYRFGVKERRFRKSTIIARSIGAPD